MTGTLLSLGDLGVVVALKLIGLVLNMFCTLIFLGHSLDPCLAIQQSMQG